MSSAILRKPGFLFASRRLGMAMVLLHLLASPGVRAKTGSFGIAAWRAGESTDALMKRVDEALYRAKREGRNRVCAETAEMDIPGTA